MSISKNKRTKEERVMRKKEYKSIHGSLYELLIELDRIARNNKLEYNLAYGTALGAVREKGFIDWDTDIDVMVTIDEYERFCNILELELKETFYLYTRKKNKDYHAMFNRIGFKNIPHDELHIDIFPMVGAPRGKIRKRIFGIISHVIHFGNSYKNRDIKRTAKRVSKKAVFILLICKVILLPVPNKLMEYFYNKLKIAFPIKKSSYVYNISGTYGNKEFIPKAWIKESEYKTFEGLKLPVPKEWDKYLTQIYDDYMTPRR